MKKKKKALGKQNTRKASRKRILVREQPKTTLLEAVEGRERRAPRKVDVLIPSSDASLDFTADESRDRSIDVQKLESILLTTPVEQKHNDEKLQYGPGGGGKFYEKGGYQRATYEATSQYKPTVAVEPALTESSREMDYSGVHFSDKMFERFTETKKREEEATQYKKKEPAP